VVRANPNSGANVLNPACWVEDHGDYLFGLARFRTRDRCVAEDLVQDTLLTGLRSIDRFQGRSSERTWLTGILKNKIRAFIRTKDREVSISSLIPDDPAPEAMFDAVGHMNVEFAPKDWGTDPIKVLERSEFHEVLKKCLDGIPSRTAEVFLAREIEGDSTDEIADCYGLTKNNLWVLLHRARQMLRKCLEQSLYTA
jgi:RNA polymerase sigma-70 factor (TIGR02943 family)